MLLDDRLTHAKLVNTVADGVDGLSDRTILEVGHGLRLHAQSPRILSTGIERVLRQAITHDAAQVSIRFRRHSFDYDLIRIIGRVGLVYVCVVNFSAGEFVLEALHRAIGIAVDGVVHLYLQDQVSSAFEV